MIRNDFWYGKKNFLKVEPYSFKSKMWGSTFSHLNLNGYVALLLSLFKGNLIVLFRKQFLFQEQIF